MPLSTDTIIFDLSEVIISGIIGIERILSRQLGFPEANVLSAFNCQDLQDLCCGYITEDCYLHNLITRNAWQITVNDLKAYIRDNLNVKVDGMEQLLVVLSTKYRLVLLSDNAKEWVSYISSIHHILDLFKVCIFSYQICRTKRQTSTFKIALQLINRRPDECIFIDDNPGNVRRAQSVGMKSIQFKSPNELVSDLSLFQIERKVIEMAKDALKRSRGPSNTSFIRMRR